MSDERQNLQELAAHFAQGSPAVAAMDWVNAFLSRGLGAVWARTDPDLRLAITQTFIVTNQAHPEIAGQDRDRLAERIVHADGADGWTGGCLTIWAISSGRACPRGLWAAGAGCRRSRGR